MYHQYVYAISGCYPEIQRLMTLRRNAKSHFAAYKSYMFHCQKGGGLYYMFYCMENMAYIPGFTYTCLRMGIYITGYIALGWKHRYMC